MSWFLNNHPPTTTSSSVPSSSAANNIQPILSQSSLLSSSPNASRNNVTYSTSPQHDDQDVDTLMANELSQLSFQERNQIQEEIHGVHSIAPQETPELLHSSLNDIDREIQTHISERLHHSRATHNQQDLMFFENLSSAIYTSPLLKSAAFRIKFLRADLFASKKAAIRMVGHLRLLCKYFGNYALQRPIRFTDLGEVAQDVLRQGVYQILPSRDRAKRLIICHHGAFEGKNVTNTERIKVQLYFSCVISEDVETQKNGMVLLFSADNRIINHITSSQEDFGESVTTYPLRWSGIHVCLPKGPAFQLLKAVLMMTVGGTDQRVRAKFHPELAKLETQYQLMTYGIPIQELPVSFTGTTKTKNLNHWIQTRIAVDEAREQGYDTSSLVLHPGTYDVLFSKGGNARHQGNLEFHQVMDSRINRYNTTSSRKEKREIRDEIINTIRSRNGRFLEMSQHGYWWVEMKDEVAIHNKVTSAINDHTRTMKARQNRQKSQSDTEKFLITNKRRKLDGACCM